LRPLSGDSGIEVVTAATMAPKSPALQPAAAVSGWARST